MNILKIYMVLGWTTAIMDIILYDDSHQSNDEVFYQYSKKLLFNLVAWPKTIATLILRRRHRGQA